MKNKVKIKISYEAYVKLSDLLKASEDYNCIRFKYKDGCCGSSKIDIYLDNYEEGDILDKIDDLSVIYNSEVTENILEITLVYRNSSFMVKTVASKELFKDCSSCSFRCKSKAGCSCSS